MCDLYSELKSQTALRRWALVMWDRIDVSDKDDD
jgi:hypothetical protein